MLRRGATKVAKILLIENMKSVRRALAARLKEAGHDIVEAEDGGDAIAYLRQHNVDLVITEMLLDKHDGTEVLAFIESQPIKPPVIAMTGGNSQIPADMAILPAKALATATLTKPIDETVLLGLITRLLAT